MDNGLDIHDELKSRFLIIAKVKKISSQNSCLNPQVSHINGLSFVCLNLLCLSRAAFSTVAQGQWSQWYLNKHCSRNRFPVWLRNWIISVLCHTVKSCIASYYKFSTNYNKKILKLKPVLLESGFGPSGLTKLVIILKFLF